MANDSNKNTPNMCEQIYPLTEKLAYV